MYKIPPMIAQLTYSILAGGLLLLLGVLLGCWLASRAYRGLGPLPFTRFPMQQAPGASGEPGEVTGPMGHLDFRRQYPGPPETVPWPIPGAPSAPGEGDMPGEDEEEWDEAPA